MYLRKGKRRPNHERLFLCLLAVRRELYVLDRFVEVEVVKDYTSAEINQ
jgi:hypothetical protein